MTATELLPIPSAQSPSSERQLVAFRLAGEMYALDIALIQEIIRLPAVTRIPRADADVEGVINLRGKIVPIVNLRRRLRLPDAGVTRATRVIVTAAADTVVGLVVDSVTGVLRLAPDAIEPPDTLFSGVGREAISGVGRSGDDLVLLLDGSLLLQPVLPEATHVERPGDLS